MTRLADMAKVQTMPMLKACFEAMHVGVLS